ncbi:hypothetical protein TNCV_4404641 [Trichonephila clavipes]|uniref:Uncharacterized protein n=1 Tax=Trichonephila clavipes TaxID=2585209 RepID=A0A8X6V5P7_TRICX|nr:hypothetical protein TNCV_4404641 [Trichonephila clavipes]
MFPENQCCHAAMFTGGREVTAFVDPYLISPNQSAKAEWSQLRTRGWDCFCRVIGSSPGAIEDHRVEVLMHVKSLATQSPQVEVV